MIISPVPFFYFFKILIFWVVRVVKVQKMAKMFKRKIFSRMKKKILSVSLYISGTVHHACDFWCKWYVQKIFSFFQNFDFWVFLGGKRAKNDPKLPNSVHHVPYLRISRSYQDSWYAEWSKIMISPGVFIYFLKNATLCNKILFFIFPLQQFFW